MQPISFPSRSRNPATEVLALVTCGFWPEILARLSTATSMSDLSWVALPTPMLMTIFSSLGIAILLAIPNFSASSWETDCW